MKIAVTDISSSSISLVICDENGEEISRHRESVSALVFTENNRLTRLGVDRIADALAGMQEECRLCGVDELYVIVTSAIRFIENKDEVADAIRERTGVIFNIVDGNKEAYCDYLAQRRHGYGADTLLVDVGGGSIEICDMARAEQGELFYLPFGAITLQQKYVKGIFPDEDEVKKIKNYVKKQVAGLDLDTGYETCVLLGALAQAIYRIYADVYKLGEDEEPVMEYGKLKSMVKMLRESPKRSQIIMKNASEKIHFIMPAMYALMQILKKHEPKKVVVSSEGVKEGYVQFILQGGQGQQSPFRREGGKTFSSAEELAQHISRVSKEQSKQMKKAMKGAGDASGDAKKAKENKSDRPSKADK